MRYVIVISATVIFACIFVLFVIGLWVLFAPSRGGSRSSKRHRRYVAKAKRVTAVLRGGTLSQGQAVAYLRKVNPYVFEEVVLNGFLNKGFGIHRNRRYSGDGGVDGRVTIAGKEYLIQCKRYHGHIDRRHVEDFSRVCLKENKEGYFVHTGRTGKGARDEAEHWGNVRVVSGRKLLDLLGYRGPERK